MKVAVANNDQLVLPATLRVTLEGGGHVDVAIPVETWMQQSSNVFTIATPARALSVALDPEHRIPDKDRSNNSQTLAK